MYELDENIMSKFKYNDSYEAAYGGYESMYTIEKEQDYTSEQKEIFDNAQAGDVIWCHMPFQEATLQKIPDGHRQRPYVVAGKTSNRLICYQCSTKVDSQSNLPKHKLIVVDFANNKYSKVCLHRLFYLRIGQIITPFAKLNETEKGLINRKLHILQRHTISGIRLLEFGKPLLEKYDLVTYNNQKYVLRKEKQGKWLGYEWAEGTEGTGVYYETVYCKGYADISKEIELELDECILEGIPEAKTIQDLKQAEHKRDKARKNNAKAAKKKQKRVHISYTYPLGTVLTYAYNPDKEYLYMYRRNNQETVLDIEKFLIETRNIKGMAPVGYAYEDEMADLFDIVPSQIKNALIEEWEKVKETIDNIETTE